MPGHWHCLAGPVAGSRYGTTKISGIRLRALGRLLPAPTPNEPVDSSTDCLLEEIPRASRPKPSQPPSEKGAPILRPSGQVDRIVPRMRRPRVIRNAALVVVVALLGGGSFFWGDKHALETQIITRATPDQLANSMQQDTFYSNYRGSTLLIDATIASVTDRAGATIIKLVTTSSLTVLCNLGQAPALTHAGDAVTLVAEGAAAQRQSAGVFLQGCEIAN